MTELEKIILANLKGYKCDYTNGVVIGPRGKEITKQSSEGYIYINLRHQLKRYVLQVHRFLFFNFNNYLPEQIDHINRDRRDNRLINLRASTQSKNQWNRSNTKGYTKVKDRYRAYIRCNNKRINLGYYNTEQEAHNAYLNAKSLYHLL